MISTILAFIDNYPEAYVGICCIFGLALILIGGLSDGSGRR